MGNYYSNYGGQTFYKTNSPSDSKDLQLALNKESKISRAKDLSSGQIILIPDGSEISEEPQAGWKLGGFSPDARLMWTTNTINY